MNPNTILVNPCQHDADNSSIQQQQQQQQTIDDVNIDININMQSPTAAADSSSIPRVQSPRATEYYNNDNNTEIEGKNESESESDPSSSTVLYCLCDRSLSLYDPSVTAQSMQSQLLPDIPDHNNDRPDIHPSSQSHSDAASPLLPLPLCPTCHRRRREEPLSANAIANMNNQRLAINNDNAAQSMPTPVAVEVNSADNKDNNDGNNIDIDPDSEPGSTDTSILMKPHDNAPNPVIMYPSSSYDNEIEGMKSDVGLPTIADIPLSIPMPGSGAGEPEPGPGLESQAVNPAPFPLSPPPPSPGSRALCVDHHDDDPPKYYRKRFALFITNIIILMYFTVYTYFLGVGIKAIVFALRFRSSQVRPIDRLPRGDPALGGWATGYLTGQQCVRYAQCAHARSAAFDCTQQYSCLLTSQCTPLLDDFGVEFIGILYSVVGIIMMLIFINDTRIRAKAIIDYKILHRQYDWRFYAALIVDIPYTTFTVNCVSCSPQQGEGAVRLDCWDRCGILIARGFIVLCGLLKGGFECLILIFAIHALRDGRCAMELAIADLDILSLPAVAILMTFWALIVYIYRTFTTYKLRFEEYSVICKGYLYK